MRRVRLFTVMATIFVFSILPVACQPITKSETDSIPTLDSKLYGLMVPAAKPNVENAYERARAWSSDAILISVDVVVPPGGQAKFTMFSFSSKTNSKENLILSYKNGNVTSRVFDWNRSYDSNERINLDRWLIDSTEAFEIAQQHGGQEHMLNIRGNIDIMLLLQVVKSNTLVWRVSYRSLDGNGTLYIGIDAETGEFMWIDPP